MFMSELAMLVSRSCVLLGLVVFAEIMVMGRLMMMVRRRVVVSSGLVMILTRWMFSLGPAEKQTNREDAKNAGIKSQIC